ncbi:MULTISPECIES: porin family protein [unclassified Photobacterium]|uniref:porin family protein n=1 Tax=unclassified Photobacterium TaxID=2628852 RepID=UPI001EDE282B|nr:MULTISPECIES: porin family protein [unclassified Photobacterium]MCG3866123.1 porin family protein [Photobacterium sp. Ph6]MCG3877657.1 porin family protein [Photobacterium sp. Ph5]
MKTKISTALIIGSFSLPVLAHTSNNGVTPFIKSNNPQYYIYLGSGTYAPKTKVTSNTKAILEKMDNDLSINDFIKKEKKPNLSIGAGLDINQYLAIEGFYRYSSIDYKIRETELKETFSANEFGLSILPSTGNINNSGIKLFARLSASALITKFNEFEQDYSGLALGLGAGIQWNMNKQYMMRAEYLHTQFDHSFSDVVKGDNIDGIQLSIGYRF